MLLSNWEDKIVWQPSSVTAPPPPESDSLTTPVNKALESGAWTQSIIWGPGQPFRDFTQLELAEEDLVHEERTQSKSCFVTKLTGSPPVGQPSRQCGLASVYEQTKRSRVTSSICPMTICMKSPKMVVDIVFDRRSVSWLSSMHTPRRNSSCRL